jgi:hypothetical protein
MIHSLDLEKTVLKGLLQHPHKWAEVSLFLNEKDFFSEDSQVHLSIFKLIRNALNNAETIDDTILIPRLEQLRVSFPDSIDLPEYIRSLVYHKITEEIFVSSVRELKKFSARREIYFSARNVASYVKKVDPDLKYSEIIDKADEIYNKNIKEFEFSDEGPVNLFDIMEEMVEERGNNPVEESGLMGPHQRINDIYGSLLLEGNISVIVARSGVGKTQFCMDYTTRTAAKYQIPVLHFDNGEMSEEELTLRQCCAMTGIPVYLLKSGKWRTSSYKQWTVEEVVAKVRGAWDQIKAGKMKFYYHNVAGMSAEEMCSYLKRFYYSKVGRGNKMIFSFDYIKTDFNNLGKNEGWQQVASMVHLFKQTIQRDLCFDGKPCVSMMTSVQANRLGITGNRGADAIVDDESVVSLSDGITQFCSHLFLLRRKIADEINEDGDRFGTHKLVNLKARHLGKDALRDINLVEMPDGSNRKNFINLNVENFRIEERGDLQDIVNSINNVDVNLQEGDLSDDIPMVLSE